MGGRCKRCVKEGCALETGISVGDLEVGSFTGDSEKQMKWSSSNGVSPSVGALQGEPGGRAPLLGALKDI